MDIVPWKCIWKPKVLIRVVFFFFSSLDGIFGKILTIDNPRKRNINLVTWLVSVVYVNELGDNWSFAASLHSCQWVVGGFIWGSTGDASWG